MKTKLMRMVSSAWCIVSVALVANLAQADTTTFKGVSVDYGSASTNWVDGELVLTYTSGTSSLILGGEVKADILVVGGGGGGGGAKRQSSGTKNRFGAGGAGGSVRLFEDQLLDAGVSYVVEVGEGGTAGSGSAQTAGGNGNPSSFGDLEEQPGGTGGSKNVTAATAGTGASGSGTAGVSNSISGESLEYGKGGESGGGEGTACLGNGGGGAAQTTTSATTKNGAAGGSGVVIVRLKEVIGLLKELDLQRGEMVSEFVDASDQPISFVYSDVTCRSSADVVASVAETADGKVGIVGHLPGTTEVSIITSEKVYICTVTVNPLITGLYRAGAYEVAVTNASEVKYVDGDLVITYLDTNGATEKSFTLPQATTGRLLAVGGGGAGGQDSSKRDDTVGIPGGGGAGGLIIADSQAFAAATYAVTVGAGGVAPRTTTRKAGANGTATTVKSNGETLANALGGGGGGARSVGSAGGSGGGGSYGGGLKNGGAKQQSSPGFGNAGGQGASELFGGGGAGAGGAGGKTGSYTKFYNKSKKTFTDPTSEDVYLSGAGGIGMTCDITGESLEYARGGAGGVPRLYAYYYYKGGQIYYTNTKPTDQQKKAFDNGKYFWCEASDGKPGRDGYGDGGGGGSYYSKDYGPTFAGSGGNGAVIVRIPPYKTTVEDALKVAFADQPVTVSGSSVALNGNVAGPIRIPDNLGAVTIKLNGHAIIGANGADGDDITSGGDGQPALKIVPNEYDCESGVTVLSVTGTGSLTGGNGGKGYPGGAGAAAVSADGFTANVADGIAVTAGTAGESYIQHPHEWVYTVEDGKIVATCIAEGDCSYKTRKPFVAISASDASYTALRYSKAELVNGITPVTGVVVAPERYVGRDGTDYPESTTPPTEQGAYTVKMKLDDMTISSDFIITEPKPSQDSVYEAWKTAERRGRDVRIYLSATFAGGKAINDGNVLFLGSRCNAHSMATGTVEKSINAMTKYANVRWYAYGSSDPAMNLVNQLTRKGEEVAYKENSGKVTDETVHLEGGNHFVHKEMMDDLYAELVEKRNLDDDYDLLILEFDGDLLCRDGASPYELVYSLPEGWTDEKAAQLRSAMNRYYEENRVVWIVPDVNQPKSDAGYTGEYPWTSNPEFIWQRTFLNATETEGYRCPLQKNYEDAKSLVAYLQDTLVGHLFSNVIIKDKLADGLSITKVTPQMRGTNGVWCAFDGGPTDYSIFEPRSETTVTAKVEQPNNKDVTVTFDMREEQAWACEHDQVIGDDLRVVIDASLDGFFDGAAEGDEKATNDGNATFTFTDPNLDEDEEGYEIEIEVESPTIRNEKLTPDYSYEDIVKTYDGKGTNIIVRTSDPTPENATIRYSLDEHGTYTDTLELTNVCDKTKVWFEITDAVGEFITVTNFACVTILQNAEPELETMDFSLISAVEKFYDAEPTNITWVVTNATGAVMTDATILLREQGTTAWIPVADFAPYVDTTNVTVEVRAEKAGFTPVETNATVLVKPRPVTLVAGSDAKVYDGTPLTCDDFEVKTDTETIGYGFVKEEGVASVTMTPESTITDPGTQANVIASETAKAGTKLDRNYIISTESGTLTIADAAMDFSLVSAVEKFYDAEPTNITWVVTNATGAVMTDATILLREQGTTAWIPVADFPLYVDTTNVTVEIRAEKAGFTPVETNATVLVKPRPVTLVAGSDAKVYDGTPLTCDDFEVKTDETTEGYGFVKEEGVASVTMTIESTITDPGTQANVIASETAKAGTKLDRNYIVSTEPGTLTVAIATGFVDPIAVVTYNGDDQEPSFSVTNADGAELVKETDYTVEYFDNINVTNLAYAVVTFIGNYGGTVTNYFTISPKAVTVTSEEHEFVYNGSAQFWHELNVAGGFIAGETFTTNWLSTITDVGTTNNEFEIVFDGTARASNYALTYDFGTLEVTPALLRIGDGEGSEQDPEHLADPGDPYGISGMGTGVKNVVKEYKEGETTNIVVNVIAPASGADVLYSTNQVDWVDCYYFEEPMLTQKVYYAVSAPNYHAITNFGYVTIYLAEVEQSYPEDVSIDEDVKENVEQDLRDSETNDVEYADHSYIKYKLTVSRTNDLDTVEDLTRTTRTYRAEAVAWHEMLKDFAETNSVECTTNESVEVVHSVFYDVILERTYTPVTEYNWQDWDDIGDPKDRHGDERDPDDTPLISVPLPFEEPINMRIFGVFMVHSNKTTNAEEIYEIKPAGTAEEGEQYYEITRDPVNPRKGTVIAYLRKFCGVIIPMVSTVQDARFSATLKWTSFAGNQIARIEVTNLNEAASFVNVNYKEGSMRFAFDERTDDNELKASLFNPAGGKARTNEVINGTEYPVMHLNDPANGWDIGMGVAYGPADNASVVEKLYQLTNAPVVRANSVYDVSKLTGWLVWETQETTYAIPIAADPDLATKLDEIVPQPIAGGPVTLDDLNLAMELGVAFTNVTEFGCRFTEFAITEMDDGEDAINGKIMVTTGREEFPPTTNMVVTLFGTEDLAQPFKLIKEQLEMPDGDGRFVIEKSEDDAYFYKADVKLIEKGIR